MVVEVPPTHRGHCDGGSGPRGIGRDLQVLLNNPYRIRATAGDSDIEEAKA